MQPQVNKVRGVTDTLWQSKKDTLHTKIHRINYQGIQSHILAILSIDLFDTPTKQVESDTGDS